MLHPRVGSDNEISAQPRTEPDQKAGPPVSDRPEFLFTKQEQTKKTRFQKKRKYPFHRERLSDHSSRGPRKLRPVGAELKFHGDSSHHAHGEIDRENFAPKARRAIVVLVTGAPCLGFQIYKEQRKAHRKLRKNVVKRHREGELQTMDVDRMSH